MQGAVTWSGAGQLLLLLEHVGNELRQRARALAAAAREPDLRGIVITDQEFDQLLQQDLGQPTWEPLSTDSSASPSAHWTWFAHQFGLCPQEELIVLICLLPEIDISYERIFGYLQDNVTARRPTVDLLLRLLATDLPERLALRRLFRPQSTLLRWDIIRLGAAESDPPGLATQRVSLHPLVVEHLLNPGAPPEPSNEGVKLLSLDERPSTLVASPGFERLPAIAPQAAWLQVDAHYVGLARQLAQALCHKWQKPLVQLDLANTDSPDEAVRTARLLTALRDAALLVTGLGADRPEATQRELAERVATMLGQLSEPILWHCALQITLAPPQGIRTWPLSLESPDYTQRLRCWETSLPAQALTNHAALETAAARYRLDPDQIAWAGRAAHDTVTLRDGEDVMIGFADLAEAARRASSRDIGQLAHRLEPRHDWDDLVLPADRIAQLREMCDQLTYRHVVMEQWAYGRRSGAPGLSALFAGPSGTGKTMAAEVIATELALDLYRIDLSGVVSKYIGETEKNLERIFELARDSNAILLFDEADALFGKRSETRDAHDRYANIEVSYLLQKIEAYDGLVILTSNLRQNLDEAFMRRLQLSVDFPFPDETARLALWKKLITAETPTGELDLELLSHRYRLSGGSIRNVIITAAYLAARDEALLDTGYLVWAIRREYQKLGRLVETGQFEATEHVPQITMQSEYSDA